MQEPKSLEKKYKAKCKKLIKANIEIKKLRNALELDEISRYADLCEMRLLREITSNMDRSFYNITFLIDYEEKRYIEKNVSSFGSRWMKEALIIHLAHWSRKERIKLYDSQIEIISAEKVY